MRHFIPSNYSCQIIAIHISLAYVAGAWSNGSNKERREEDTRGERFLWASREGAPSPLACSFLHITSKRQLRRLTSLPKPRKHKKPRRKSRTKLFFSYWRFLNPLSINLIILVFHDTLFLRIALLHHLMSIQNTQSLDLLWQGLMLPWQNSRHLATPPLASPRNDFWETTVEIPSDDASLPRSG